MSLLGWDRRIARQHNREGAMVPLVIQNLRPDRT